MKTNNTHDIDFEEIIYIILLILCIIAFFIAAKELEESIPKSTINTYTQTIKSHKESESETIEYINQIPGEYTITYGWFDPDKYRSE